MSDIAIRVENPCPEWNRRVSKRYRIGRQEERHDTLANTLNAVVKRPIQNLRRLRRLTSFGDGNVQRANVPTSNASDIIWVLKDVSFEVKRREVVGIPSASLRTSIGRNGAGKSTLTSINSAQASKS